MCNGETVEHLSIAADACGQPLDVELDVTPMTARVGERDCSCDVAEAADLPDGEVCATFVVARCTCDGGLVEVQIDARFVDGVASDGEYVFAHVGGRCEASLAGAVLR